VEEPGNRAFGQVPARVWVNVQLLVNAPGVHHRGRSAWVTSSSTSAGAVIRAGAPALASLSLKFCIRGGQRLMTLAAAVYWPEVWVAGWAGLPHQRARDSRICGVLAVVAAAAQAI
jgi:hypothetical protein